VEEEQVGGVRGVAGTGAEGGVGRGAVLRAEMELKGVLGGAKVLG